MRKSERKRKVDLPPNFNSMRIKESAKVKTPVTEKEIEKMRELRELGLSYQKIAEALGRAKLAVMYHLKERKWVEELLADNKERSRVWYENNKDKKHSYYEHRKELCRRGELE